MIAGHPAARWRCGGLLLLPLLFVAPARAHDPFEITADARFRADALELVVTMAPSTAMRVIARPGEKPARFNPEEFERLRPRFVASAAELFRITSGERSPPLRRVTVELGRELDIEFHLQFAPPAASRVRFHATHLARLADGYGDVLTVHDRGGELLGQELLQSTAPAFEVVAAGPAQPARSS